MNELSLSIPFEPPSVNSYVRHTKLGRHYLTSGAKTFQEAVAVIARGEKVSGKAYEVTYVVYQGAKRKGDVDNYAKCILDSLVKAGVIESDALVVSLHCHKLRDRNRPRTEIKVQAIAKPRCGHEWIPIIASPLHCAKCKSRLWNGSTRGKVMKTLIVLLLLSSAAFSEELPNAPKPHIFANKTELGLIAGEFSVRIMDTVSTRQALTNPCHCLHETNVGAIANSTGTSLAYSTAVSGAIIGLSYGLHRFGFHKLEKLPLMIDIAYDGKYVIGNYHAIAGIPSISHKVIDKPRPR